jgi:hypothetical protein
MGSVLSKQDYDYDGTPRYSSGYQDVEYGDFVHDYLVEPERIGYLKSVILAKKQVIQMLERELRELERELMDETAKSNVGKDL